MRDEHGHGALGTKALRSRGGGGGGGADPAPPAVAGRVSVESKGVNLHAEAAGARVPPSPPPLLLLRLLLLPHGNRVCVRARTGAPQPPHPSSQSASLHPSRVRRALLCVGPWTGPPRLLSPVRGVPELSLRPPLPLPRVGAAGGGFHRGKVQKAQARNPDERRSRRQPDWGGPGARVSEAAQGPPVWRSGDSAAHSAAPLPGPSPLRRGSSLAVARGEGGATRDLKVHRLRSGARICSRRPRPD